MSDNQTTEIERMKTYTAEELKVILENHRKWYFSEDGGSRANLCGANLRGANLCRANLCGANLRGANLCGANLCGANLRDANLCCADLYGANLRGADLYGADLCGANLRGANLRGADLYGADLRGANLFDLFGNKVHVKTIATEKWTINYTATILQIGCQQHPINNWFEFSDEKISNMADGALDWWKKWKDIIKQIIEMSPAEPTKAGE